MEILPGSTSQISTIQIVFFHLLQSVQPQMKAREKFIEEGVAPGNTAVLRGEEVEDLLEHQMVVTGALSHLDWGDILSFPRKFEVGSVL